MLDVNMEADRYRAYSEGQIKKAFMARATKMVVVHTADMINKDFSCTEPAHTSMQN